jgi:hypothetical protein
LSSICASTAPTEQDLVDQVDAQLAAALGQADVAALDLFLQLLLQLVRRPLELRQLAGLGLDGAGQLLLGRHQLGLFRLELRDLVGRLLRRRPRRSR